MSEASAKSNGNGGISGLKNLNWPTVVLILVTGGGSWFSTVQKGNELSYEQREALGKIRELHADLDDEKKTTREARANFESILANDRAQIEKLSLALENQGKMLSLQNQTLKEVRDISVASMKGHP